MKSYGDKSRREKVATNRMQTCAGCRNCEIACSYHHEKVFSRARSSLEIAASENYFEITLHGVNDGHTGCDRCRGLPEPMCVKYCPSVARAEMTNLLEKAWRCFDDA